MWTILRVSVGLGVLTYVFHLTNHQFMLFPGSLAGFVHGYVIFDIIHLLIPELLSPLDIEVLHTFTSPPDRRLCASG